MSLSAIEKDVTRFRILYYSYCKSGNFHVKIIRVLNIHIDLFSWVYGTRRKYFNMNIRISTRTFITIVLLILRMSISLHYLANIIYSVLTYYVYTLAYHSIVQYMLQVTRQSCGSRASLRTEVT